MIILEPSRRKSFIYRGNIYTAFANFNRKTDLRRLNFFRVAANTPPDYNFQRFKDYAKAFQHEADIYISENRLVIPLPFGVADYYPLFAFFPYKPVRHRR